MRSVYKAVTIGCVMAMAGITGARAEVSQADIDALKAGQEAIRKELAEIRKLVSPKPAPERVSDISHTVDIAADPYKGSTEAPVTIIEYTDYQCPYCGRHARGVLPLIQKNYVDKGKVRYVLRDYPLPFHKQAEKAAEAAHCAGDQGKYWEMHDKLFANQQALEADKLPGYAEAIGIDVEQFKTCLNGGVYADRVKANALDGSKAGVRGTPSFVVGTSDGTVVKGLKLVRGAVGYNEFQATFDELLKQQ